MNKEPKDYQVMVVGAGTMGNSMAQVLAASGLKVWMTSRHQDTLDRAKDAISIAVREMLENNLADENYLSRVWDNLQLITNDHIPEVADKMDIVFETVVENKDAKREIYSLLDRYCRPDCIFASNTSGMDIFSVTAGIVHHPERQIIAHWFNPPHLMTLVEVVCGEKTSAKTTSAVRSLLEYVGKKPAVLNHFVPGFIVNRIATVINRELYYMIDQGWISGEDASNAIRYTDGLRYGFEGPLELWDFVGLGITMTVARDVLPTLCNDPDTIPYGEKLLAAGKTGVKAGEGVLKYGSLEKYVERRNKRIVQMTRIMKEWDQEDEEENKK